MTTKPSPELQTFADCIARAVSRNRGMTLSKEEVRCVAALLDGLWHQIYRNHACCDMCAACAASMEAVRNAKGEL